MFRLQKIYKDEEFKFERISCSKDGNEMRNGGFGMNFGIKIQGVIFSEIFSQGLEFETGRKKIYSIDRKSE